MNMRRLRWNILSGICILCIAIFSAVAAGRILYMHDRLGSWNLTVLDVQGRTVGHGQLELIARSWTFTKDWYPPYLHWTPQLTDRLGSFTLTPAGTRILTAATHGVWNATGVNFSRPHFWDNYETILFMNDVKPRTPTRLSIALRGNSQRETADFVYFSPLKTVVLPLTLVATR